MNSHIPQSISALAETSILMRAESHIISGQSNAPVNGIVQDGLDASYILTNTWDDGRITLVPIEIVKECIFEAGISEERCTNMLIRASKVYPEYIGIKRGTSIPFFKKKKIPGKIFASILFPPNLNYKRKTDTNPKYPVVEIKDGIILPSSGPLCKKVIGAKANSIVHLLFIEYSPDETLRFLSDCQQITDRWFPNHGFSMGIVDCMTTSNNEVEKTLLEMRLNMESILGRCNGIPNAEEEAEINGILNSAMNVGLTIAKESMVGGDMNALNIMRSAGAKGSLVNLTQIVSFVGQQNIGGQRIPASLSGKTRTLPHFIENDHSAEARGFVSNGYLKGLNPTESFFHAAAGRTGIISTSIKSVTYDTNIFIIENEIPKTVKIGEWIDEHILNSDENKIERYEEMEMEYLPLSNTIYIPTVDSHGNITWELVSAATRHLPTENLYNIVTELGREVTVAESKSLIVFNHETTKLEHKHLLDITENDYLPVTQLLPQFHLEITEFNIPSHVIENPGGNKKFLCDRNHGYFLGALIASCSFVKDNVFIIRPKTPHNINMYDDIFHVLDRLKVKGHLSNDGQLYVKSTILGKFIYKMSKNLNEIILTCLEFKEGILDGYFSFCGICDYESRSLIFEEDGCPSIPEFSIINMLCNGFGIVTRLCSPRRFQIDGIYLAIMKNTISITNDILQEKINECTLMYEDGECSEFFGNVCLDKIKSIEKIKSGGEKLYDLTIPSTLNFCLANGLHVADTSDTGYIQKKIGRKIEDCKAYIDGTVRIGNGRIIQFLYGDDGMNPKFLYVPKGLDFPFFVNPINISRRLNSDAIQKNMVSVKDKPRKLNDAEINLLLSFINAGVPYLKSDVIENSTNVTRIILRKLLEDEELIIYECMIPMFCSEIKNMYESAKIHYGEMVGLHTASFIGEPTTQMMLDVFHNTGVKGKDVSIGVPRFNELLNATKSNKQKKISQTIYFDIPELNRNKEFLKGNPENEEMKKVKLENFCILEKLRKKFEETSVGTFIKHFEMRYLSSDIDPDVNMSPIKILTYEEYEKKWWVELKEEFFGEPKFKPEHWVVVLHFDIEKLYMKEIELEDIAIAIEEDSDDKYYCCASPSALGVIEVYCNFSVIKEYVKNKIELPEDVQEKTLITNDNLNYFVCRDVIIGYLCNIKLSGIFGIKRVYPREVVETGEWVLDADCREIQTKVSNNRFLESLNTEGVNPYSTIIDDMHTIQATLGIEATRKFLIEELTRIISFDGVYINPRHIQLLVDSMTYTGEITSVRRDGISRDVGPNAKIMFEQAVDNAVEASAFSEFDDMSGVSSSIMYGLTSKAGTGMVEVKPIDQLPMNPIKIQKDIDVLNLKEVNEEKETMAEKRKRFTNAPGTKRKSIIRK
jgi:DNA-directed RNA polymerase beta' subunit